MRHVRIVTSPNEMNKPVFVGENGFLVNCRDTNFAQDFDFFLTHPL
jgi:hypothetical protein